MTSQWPSRRLRLLALLAVSSGLVVSVPGSAHARPVVQGVCPSAAKDLCDAGKLLLENGNPASLAASALPGAASSGLGSIADGAFGAMAAKFAEAGIALLDSLADAFVESSTVDLSSSGVDPVLALTMPVAMLVAVLLVVVAAAKTAVTGQGAVVATALVGLVKTVLVTILLVTVVQMALKASDALTTWIIDRSLGGNEQLEHRLATLISLDALAGSPALLMVFGLLAIVVGMLLWVELLFRHVAIVVLVAVAPIAATGQILGETAEWWAKARTALIQLILLKPVIALCFAVGFSTLGAAGDLMGVIAGFVTLMLAAVAWPLLARFMSFTAVGGGHGALAGLVATGAGFLAGRRTSRATAAAGPSAVSGSAYAVALESQNDTSAMDKGGASGTGTVAASRGVAAGGVAAGIGAAVGAAATAAAATLDHAEAQMTSAAADAGLGHATRPGGTYGHTRGRFRGTRHRTGFERPRPAFHSTHNDTSGYDADRYAGPATVEHGDDLDEVTAAFDPAAAEPRPDGDPTRRESR